METSILLWILIFPLSGAFLLALGRRRLPRTAIGALASLAIAAGFVLTLVALGMLNGSPDGGGLKQTLFEWSATDAFTLPFGLLGDQLALWWLVVVTGVGLLVHVYSIAYMAEERDLGRYFAELNYFVFAMSLMVLADNFVGLLMGWANVGLASFMLIGYWNQKPEAAQAAKKAFVINAIGEVGLILAFVAIFNEFRSLAFADVFGAVSEASPGALTFIGVLLLIGAVAKSAQLPLHTWLPDAMQGPTPVSALMHAATMVTAGVYLMIRAFPIYQGSEAAMTAVAVVGAVTALFGALVATRQFDIKKILAFSTMSQLGYMMLGAGVGAYAASAFHFFTHAFFKALLFLGAGMVIHYLDGEQDIRKMGGIGKRLPIVYWTFFAGVLAIAGAPPFAGFFSKDEILAAVLAEGHVALWTIALLAAGLTAFYMIRLFALVFAGDESTGYREARAGSPAMTGPVVILAVLSVVAGLIGIPGVTAVPAEFLGPVFQQYGLPPAASHGIDAFVALVLLVAAVGAGLGVKAYGPSGKGRQAERAAAGQPIRGAVGQGFYLDPLYQQGVGGLIMGVSALISSVLEPFVIDGAVNGLGHVAKRAGEGVRRLHTGLLRRYALTLFAGMALFTLYFVLI